MTPSAWKRSVEPTVEPVSLPEVKDHLSIDEADTSHDDHLEALIPAARDMVEQLTGRALITQTWQVSYNGWPATDRFALPFPPVQSVTSLVYTDSAGDATTVSAATVYAVDLNAEPAVLYLRYGASWPSAVLRPQSPITVTLVAGYGAAEVNVPQWARLAVKVLVGHWLEHREMVGMETPAAVQRLCYPHRVAW